MSAVKRVVMLTVLACAGLWPLAHYPLVQAYEFNPWRFGGWAMYTTPLPPTPAVMFNATNNQLVLMAQLPRGVDRELKEFQKRRHALGPQAMPTEAVREAFADDPNIEKLGVVVQQFSLDHETATMASKKVDYWYKRDEFAQTGQPSERGLLERIRNRQQRTGTSISSP